MTDRSRQTVLMVVTGGQPPVQLTVSESSETVQERIGHCLAAGEAFIAFSQPLDNDGRVVVRVADILAFWDQWVEVIRDPRALGMKRTPGGIELPDLPN